MKRIFVSLATAMQPPLAIWLSGADIFSRGLLTGTAYTLAIFLFLGVYTYPGWEKK